MILRTLWNHLFEDVLQRTEYIPEGEVDLEWSLRSTIFLYEEEIAYYTRIDRI